jgi:hypothetical protein
MMMALLQEQAKKQEDYAAKIRELEEHKKEAENKMRELEEHKKESEAKLRRLEQTTVKKPNNNNGGGNGDEQQQLQLEKDDSSDASSSPLGTVSITDLHVRMTALESSHGLLQGKVENLNELGEQGRLKLEVHESAIQTLAKKQKGKK